MHIVHNAHELKMAFFLCRWTEEQSRILKDIWKMMSWRCYIISPAISGTTVLHHGVLTYWIVKSLTFKKLNVIWTKSIFDHSFNIDWSHKLDIRNMNILLITLFLHSRQHFNGNFLYFYFCKGWDACRFLPKEH